MREAPRRKKKRTRNELSDLRLEVEALRHSYLTALAWIAQAAGSPLSVSDLTRLYEFADPPTEGRAND